MTRLGVFITGTDTGVGKTVVACELVRRLRGRGFETGVIKAVSYEYGNTFTAVGGLLNILVILDALDIARGYKR